MKRATILTLNLILIIIVTVYFLYFFINEKGKKQKQPVYETTYVGKFILHHASDKYLDYFITSVKKWNGIIENDIKINIYIEIDDKNPNFIVKTELIKKLNFSAPIKSKIIINSKLFEEIRKEKIKNSLILHEICHALGLGNLWEVKRTYTYGNYLDKDKYPLTYEAYKTLTDVDPIVGVPLENSGGRGLEIIHWENEDRYFGDIYIKGLKNELMTSIIQEKNSLSLITIENLKDLGWTINDSFIPDEIDFSSEIKLYTLNL